MKQTSGKSPLIRILTRIGITFAGLFLLLAIAVNVLPASFGIPSATPETLISSTPGSNEPGIPTAKPTAGLDYSTTRLSENGLFLVSYKSSQGNILISQIHQWILHVETADGQLVENATITVDGDMPEHGHGLPTRPQVTEYLGNGDYLLEGMKFQMGGWWVMDFTITAASTTDAVHFNLKLN